MVHNYSKLRTAIISILFLVCLYLAPTVVQADEPIIQTISVPASGLDYLGGADSPATWSRLGQRLTIPNRLISSIGYRVHRVGYPTGIVKLSIRDAETDIPIISEIWGDASTLPDANNSSYTIVTLNEPVWISGKFVLCVEYYGGNETDYVQSGYFSGNKIVGEWYTNYANYATDASGWHDIGEAEEGAYYYTYIDEEQSSTPNDHTALPIHWAALAIIPIGISIYLKRRRACEK